MNDHDYHHKLTFVLSVVFLLWLTVYVNRPLDALSISMPTTITIDVNGDVH